MIGSPAQTAGEIKFIVLENPKTTKKTLPTPKNPDCSTLRKYIFELVEGIGPQLRFQILSWTKRADPSPGVCPNSAWSPSYEKFIPEIAKIWTTPSTGYY